MSKIRKFISVAFGIVIASGTFASTCNAADTLIVNGSIPSIVNGNTSFANIELALPTSVLLGSTSVVKWSYLEPTFSNEAGDVYNPNKDSYGSTSPFSIKITSLGRRASIEWYSGLSVKATTVFSATVDGRVFKLPVTIDFQKSTSPDVFRRELPRLPNNFKIEIENPNPGLDAQTIIRGRFTWSGDWPHIAAQLGWADNSGNLVEDLSNSSLANGEWKQFNVGVDEYSQKGFQLFATWQIAVDDLHTQVGISLSRYIPVNIAFKAKPTPINEFTWLVEGETKGPIPGWTYKEFYSSAIIDFIANIDWSKIDSSVQCVQANWSLQYLQGNKWITQEPVDFERARFGEVCRSEGNHIVGDLHLDAYNNNGIYSGVFVKGSRNYRIWSEYLNKPVGVFKVNFVPDKTVLVKVKVDFPAIVQFGKAYTVVATVSPKFSGTCTFSTYFLGDVPVGRASLKNGKASLTFRVLWPKTNNINEQTKSISASCSGGKFSGTGGKLFLGAGG